MGCCCINRQAVKRKATASKMEEVVVISKSKIPEKQRNTLNRTTLGKTNQVSALRPTDSIDYSTEYPTLQLSWDAEAPIIKCSFD